MPSTRSRWRMLLSVLSSHLYRPCVREEPGGVQGATLDIAQLPPSPQLFGQWLTFSVGAGAHARKSTVEI
jgi:hypothetical protein